MSQTLPQPHAYVRSLVEEFAKITDEVAHQIEASSSNIAEFISQKGLLENGVVVELQGFDRMCQLLSAVSSVLRECSPLLTDCAAIESDVRGILARIPMRHARHRLECAISPPRVERDEPDSVQVF